jgi:hypothetical protein
MGACISATVRQLGDTRAQQAGLTRFFRNRSVTVAEIIGTAAARTAKAAAGRHVLLIQDTSEINFEAKAGRKRGLGRVGNGQDAGLFVHPALAVDAQDGNVLGLAAAHIWRRFARKDPNYQKLPIEAKESHKWLATPIAARDALLGRTTHTPAGRPASITVVADREADIYELFARLPGTDADVPCHLLVRANKDRMLGRNTRLLSTIATWPPAGRLDFELSGRPGRRARTVELAVRYGSVSLRQPKAGADRRDPKTVTLQVVEACEVDPPAGETPIVWRLLTTHPVASLTDAARIIDLYRRRWTVEQLFRTVKSQVMALEESFLSDGDALECLAATTLIAACQVMQLVHARGEAGRLQQASRVFEPAAIKVMTALIGQYEGKTAKQKNPHPKGSLAWAAWCIARLGGWTGYASERPPGPVTFGRGLQRFYAIAQGYHLANRAKHS